MQRSPWRWIPSLYIFEGIPCTLAISLTPILYQTMGIDVASFTFATSLLYLPWTIKPLWSPVVEMVSTKRRWVVLTQLALSVLIALLAVAMQIKEFYAVSLALLAVTAFVSASHDIAADGFYILALNERQQSFFVGIRSTFYKIATLTCSGLMPILVWWGMPKDATATIEQTADGWTRAFILLASLLLILTIINATQMPRPRDTTASEGRGLHVFADVLKSFFSHRGALPAVLFLLFYRLGESQLGKIAQVFLISDVDKGGLGMGLDRYGIVYGTAGTVALTVGGIVGGWLAARYGLRRVLWPMVALMNVPNVVYVLLAYYQPAADSAWVALSVVAEQLGYGFGFSAYMLFIINYVEGARYRTAEYALGTALMSLGMMLPSMASGYVVEAIGFTHFFLYVLVCCVPGVVCAAFIKINSNEKQRG